ncbi:hypothetical protein [uncultured Aquimarina sp.]|uniref:hypothetical protein n=1 Tax=uncultured Aquimarina sp. TaxID=575652 RepID=UPI002607638E|nr:hypothetical protein [uncultured Aquimarina sp.]
MKKITVLINLLFITFFINAQEKVLDLNDTFYTSYLSKKESFAISNQVTNDLVLLLKEKKKLYSYLLDVNYEILAKVTTKTLPSKYKNLLGYNIVDKKYTILYSNDRNSKFAILQIDFTNNSSKIKILDDFKIKKELYIKSINYNNKVHILAVTENTSDINIYTFDEDFNSQKKVVTFENLEFPNLTGLDAKITASNIFAGIPLEYRIAKIESSNPNVLETTSSQVKLYPLGNELVISFDITPKETKLCYINLDTFTTRHKTYAIQQKPEEDFSRSNSYLFDNKLFQIASSGIKLKFSILDLKTEELIKEYTIEEKDSITFKNSPIFIEGSDISLLFRKDKFRKVEKTKKFLKNVSSGSLGISAYKVANEYNIVLGGIAFLSGGGAGGGFSAGGTIGSGGFASLNFSPTSYGYRGYSTSSRTTYINCLFDTSFEHLQGDIPINKYDKLNDFEDTLPEEINAINIFMHNKILHYNYFDPKERIFKVYQFKE